MGGAAALVHNKTQQRTLAVLRQLLRAVRTTVDSRSVVDPSVRDVSRCVQEEAGVHDVATQARQLASRCRPGRAGGVSSSLGRRS